MSLYQQKEAVGIFLIAFFIGGLFLPEYVSGCTDVAVVEFAVDVPLADPVTVPPPPSSSDLPRLVTAGTSGSAPNLSATVVIEKSNKDEDTNQYVRVGDLYCGIKTTNTTSASISSFSNKCILYDGLKAGNDSPVILSSKTVSGLSGGAKTTTHHSFNVKNPSYYTLYGCANTGTNPPKETKTSDNCGARTFQAYGIPDVRVQSVAIQGGGTSLPAGATVTVVTDLANDGDNFIAGKNRKMTVSAELSGCVPVRTADVIEMSDDILSSGASGKTKTFTVTIPPVATPGTCTVTIVADPKEELLQSPNKEANRGNNRMAIALRVFDPNALVPCNAITSENWVSGGWSGLGYAPPFDGNGKQLLNAFCKEGDPNFLRITVGDSDNPMMISYLTGYVKSKTTGGFLPQALSCSGAVNQGWCQGVSSIDVSDTAINTTTKTNPTEIYGTTCEVVNGAWQCSGWRLGGGGL